jgi:hypothetical protein
MMAPGINQYAHHHTSYAVSMPLWFGPLTGHTFWSDWWIVSTDNSGDRSCALRRQPTLGGEPVRH